MITPSYSITATERVLPKLALDFTTASLDSRVTFTRTTDATHPATYVNSSGYVTAATNNQPRFDYDSVALTCKGLLIEESRSNLILQSQQFNISPWSSLNLTPTASATISPDGTNNAYNFVEALYTGAHLVQTNSIAVSNATSYTVSVFVKAKERSQILLQYADGVTNALAYFDASNGSLVSKTASVSSYSITQFADNWWRFSITLTSGSTSAQILLYPAVNGTYNYAGNGTSGIYVWGAQLEAGAFPTSYIPTTGSAATRNADVATMTGTNFSDWYNASEGTFSFVGIPSEVPSTDAAARFGFIIWDSITLNSYLRVDRTMGAGRAIVRSGGSSNVSFPNATWDLNSDAKMVIAYKNGNNGYAYNGNASIALNGNAPTNQIQLSIGQIGNGGNNWCGHISSLQYWPQRLTNNENQAFSK